MPSIAEDEEARPPLPIPPKSPRRKLPRLPAPYVPDRVLYDQVVKHKEMISSSTEYTGMSEGDGGNVTVGLRRRWRGGFKKRWCCWVSGIVFGLAVIIVALAVGLTVGLRNG